MGVKKNRTAAEYFLPPEKFQKLIAKIREEYPKRYVSAGFKEEDAQACSEQVVCILSLMLNTGMRVGETTALNVSDVVDDRGDVKDILNIRPETAKLKKRRTIPLNDDAKGAIFWLLEHNKTFGNYKNKPNDPLLISIYRKRMVPRTIQRWLVYMRGEDKWLTPHTLRHTFATVFQRVGGRVENTRDVLGHDNIRTTNRYVHSLWSDITETAKKIGGFFNLSRQT